MSDRAVKLFVCGDVMLGRGIDQILPHPGDPALREDYVAEAGAYVRMAESVNGAIPAPVDYVWPWGDALSVLDAAEPDVRVINLETAITTSDDFAPGKGVHYRMHPANTPCLAAVEPDVCVLSNNHSLDFGRAGLTETLDALTIAGLKAAGAGRYAAEAYRPAVVDAGGGRRVLVFAVGMPSSGIPTDWAATDHRSGLAFVPAPTAEAAGDIVSRVQRLKRAGDIVVVSLHWGSNWGYHVPRSHIRFAQALVDGGVDIVHGHSSHHPRPLQVYRDKLILYGCGDFVDDYEGIPGYEHFRDELRLAYLISIDPDTGRLADLQLAPLRARRLRLEHATAEDRDWLRTVLNRTSSGFGVHIDPSQDMTLPLRWERAAPGRGRDRAGRARATGPAPSGP
ncbi:CapA family protein [Streptomyces sp. NPDC051940]|uniref:CapA family protein n=1 Tax=Streptomyces sp. NPDC051940 TaxID=3155675 RepID=UPI003417B16B